MMSEPARKRRRILPAGFVARGTTGEGPGPTGAVGGGKPGGCWYRGTRIRLRRQRRRRNAPRMALEAEARWRCWRHGLLAMARAYHARDSASGDAPLRAAELGTAPPRCGLVEREVASAVVRTVS